MISFINLAICAARISLSPNLISSVEVVSFSLIIGTQLKFNKFSNVAMAFLDDFFFYQRAIKVFVLHVYYIF